MELENHKILELPLFVLVIPGHLSICALNWCGNWVTENLSHFAVYKVHPHFWLNFQEKKHLF